MFKNLDIKEVSMDLLIDVVGGLLIAIGIYNFALYAEFPMTGFSGIAIILYHIFKLPVGFSTILLNIPVAILCYKLLGRKFFLRSIKTMIISSFFIDYVAPLLPVYKGDPLLAALCTGVFAGLGYAIIYMRDSSTGGTDFIIMSVKALIPHMSLGTIAFLSDVGIILVGGILFKNVDGIIYGMIVNFLFAIVVDKVMYRVNSGKMALIVTENGKLIAKAIEDTCQRGSTILKGTGAYTGDGKEIVLCACNNKEMHYIQQVVKSTDHNSFIIIVESNEVLGEGFKLIKQGQ